VTGSATLGGKALAAGAVLDGSSWVVLADGAEVSVKHAETAREVSVRGPGDLLACPDGEERFLMTGGRITTTPTQGARPGAEVLVGTPLAVVRYGDGRMTVELGERGLVVSVTTGSAWVDGPAPGAAPEPVPAGKRTVRSGPPTDVKGVVAACEAASRSARARALEVLTPAPVGSAAAPLGARAAAHVQARRAARSTCAVAEARLGPPTEEPERAAQAARIAAANAAWRGVPSRLESRPDAVPGAPPDRAPSAEEAARAGSAAAGSAAAGSAAAGSAAAGSAAAGTAGH
jgi:hypothetical protein